LFSGSLAAETVLEQLVLVLERADLGEVAGVRVGGEVDRSDLAALVVRRSGTVAGVDRRAAGEQCACLRRTAVVGEIREQWVRVDLVARLVEDAAAIVVGQVVAERYERRAAAVGG